MKIILLSCVFFLEIYAVSTLCICWFTSANRPNLELKSSTVLEGLRNASDRYHCGQQHVISCVDYCEKEVPKRINMVTDEEGRDRFDLNSPPKTKETLNDTLGQILCRENPNMKKFFNVPFTVAVESVLYCYTRDASTGVIRPAVRYRLTKLTSLSELECEDHRVLHP